MRRTVDGPGKGECRVVSRPGNKELWRQLFRRFALVAIISIWSFVAGPLLAAALAQNRNEANASGELTARTPMVDDTLKIPSSHASDGQPADPIEFGRQVLEKLDADAAFGRQADDLVEYERQARAADNISNLSSRREYLAADGFSVETAQMRRIGITVDDDGVGLGVTVSTVAIGSPAAKAGLMGHRAVVQRVLEGVVVAVAICFPPAFIAIPLLQQGRVGESYDLIIAVDGERIRDVPELEDDLAKLSPGGIVYFNIIRGRRRLQIPVSLPDTQLPQP